MPHALHSSWLLLLPAVLLVGCQSTRPMNLGARDGRLAPCPSSLNCVSSQATDEDHRIAPFVYAGSVDDAMNRLKAIIQSLPRTAVITDTGAYLHVEFTTALFRFIDDVEFLADDSAKIIHVRSASRLGTSDLGVNRKRVEAIRKQWQETSPPP